MLLYGAGGHAGVIATLARDCGQEINAFFDDDLHKTGFSGIPVIGKYDPDLFIDEPVVIAIGNNEIRRQISFQISHRFTSLIHPSALVDQSASIGNGTVIMHGSIIQANSRIGNHVIVNSGAIIDHECRIADFVHIAPGAVLCGHICVGGNSLVGAGSCIAPDVIIGKNCIIGAGSVVTRNIPDGAIVRGNPGKIIGINAR